MPNAPWTGLGAHIVARFLVHVVAVPPREPPTMAELCERADRVDKKPHDRAAVWEALQWLVNSGVLVKTPGKASTPAKYRLANYCPTCWSPLGLQAAEVGT